MPSGKDSHAHLDWTFSVQLMTATLSVLVQTVVKHWLFAAVPDICDVKQANHFTCPHDQTFYTSSIIWYAFSRSDIDRDITMRVFPLIRGLVGPGRMFGRGQLYYPLIFGLIIGAILPIPIWFWLRRHPRSFLRHVNLPVIFNGPTFIPPATGINYSSWFVVGFIFRTSRGSCPDI